MLSDGQVESFRKRIRIGKQDECWPWTKGKSSMDEWRAYGVVWFNGKKYKAHRLAYELFNRSLLPGEIVCHHCDNPPCCNPRHLFAGSHGDNLRDCDSKGRRNLEHGVDRYNAKLDDDKIRKIRAQYIPRIVGVDTLAEKFGVSRSMIYSIVTWKRWKHVT